MMDGLKGRSMSRIYLDYNASTPIDPKVATAMRPYLEEAFGNPSSGHWAGAPAKDALVERARDQIAALLGCESDEIVFTSGGSEARRGFPPEPCPMFASSIRTEMSCAA